MSVPSGGRVGQAATRKRAGHGEPPPLLAFSCAELARRIGQPLAVRAVGAANGRNPLPIVLPCQRVIGSDGSLTGFGGGLPIRRFLRSSVL